MATPDYTHYIAGWKQRQAEAEKQRLTRHRHALSTAETVAHTLRQRWGARQVYLFGSCLDPHRFRMDSDIDIAVVGLVQHGRNPSPVQRGLYPRFNRGATPSQRVKNLRRYVLVIRRNLQRSSLVS